MIAGLELIDCQHSARKGSSLGPYFALYCAINAYKNAVFGIITIGGVGSARLRGLRKRLRRTYWNRPSCLSALDRRIANRPTRRGHGGIGFGCLAIGFRGACSGYTLTASPHTGFSSRLTRVLIVIVARQANNAFFRPRLIPRPFCPCRPGVGSSLSMAPLFWLQGQHPTR